MKTIWGGPTSKWIPAEQTFDRRSGADLGVHATVESLDASLFDFAEGRRDGLGFLENIPPSCVFFAK